MKRVKDYLVDVLGKEAGFTICIWILSSAPAIWYHLSAHQFENAFSMALQGLLVAFLVTCICCIFKSKARKWVKVAFIVLAAINVCVDKFVYNVTHSCFSEDTVAIILGSNVSESNEFLSIYVTDKILIFSAASIALACIFLALNKLIAKIPGKVLIPICSLLFVVSIYALKESESLKSVFMLKSILFAQYEKPKDLSLYRQDPTVICETNQPQNVVVILGESLNASHCSLYGYEKDTTPKLSELVESGMALYDNVLSADLSTIPAFKKMMSTFTDSVEDESWYTCLTVFDIVEHGGYDIRWISNQSATGVYDNIVTSYASLSDTLIWCGEKNLGMKKRDLDEIVIPTVQEIIHSSEDGHHLWFIHLMGSHEGFAERYPVEYDIFKPADYTGYPDSQKATRAAYDNSVLYNDMVVSEIMKSFNDSEAVIIYISDHGLDIFGSDAGYYGHARKSDPASVKAANHVPFIVYGTETYKTEFPDEWERISKGAEEQSSFNLENLMFTIMDLCNISLADSTQMGPSIFDRD